MCEITDHDSKYFENLILGDKEAFSSLFTKYYEPLYRFAGRFVVDPDISENIVQDVFVRLWEQRSRLRITSNVKAYLYTAVKNQSLNHIKREGRLLSFEEQFEIISEKMQSPEDEFIKDESFKSIHEAIEDLPEKCRKIYLMKRYDDLSYNEISEILSISVNTIKTQMKRALKSLGSKLQHLKVLIFYF
ncbi:RNA polymerase sigma factor [Bacteroidota bacterium]